MNEPPLAPSLIGRGTHLVLEETASIKTSNDNRIWVIIERPSIARATAYAMIPFVGITFVVVALVLYSGPPAAPRSIMDVVHWAPVGIFIGAGIWMLIRTRRRRVLTIDLSINVATLTDRPAIGREHVDNCSIDDIEVWSHAHSRISESALSRSYESHGLLLAAHTPARHIGVCFSKDLQRVSQFVQNELPKVLRDRYRGSVVPEDDTD